MRDIILILICLLIWSCKTKEYKPTLDDNNLEFKQTDSIIDGNTLDSNDNDPNKLDYIKVDARIKKDLTNNNFIKEIQTNLIHWIVYYKRLSPNFRIQDFKNNNVTLIQPYQVDFGDDKFQKRFLTLYNPFLIWSPDSSKAIDLYSYNIILDYNLNGQLIGGRDVDCQLAIIDLKKQKRINLLTFGPAGEFQDAFWINNDSIIVAMIEFNANETYQPCYSMIDLKTYLMRDYKMDHKLQLKENNYLENIFRDVKF
jgi:hypothetical protein